MSRSVTRRIDPLLLVLLVAALAVRLAFVLKIAPGLVHPDQDDYLEAARRLLDGRPMAFRNFHLFVRPPGFSLFIALLWKLTGTQSLTVIKIGNALVGTATCWYAGLLASILSERRSARLLAVAGAAVYPYFIYYSAMAGTETLSVFFVAAGTYHLARGLSATPRPTQTAIGSLLLSIGNLVRAHVTVLWPLVGAWLVWRYRDRARTALTQAALVLLPLVAVSLPWSVAVARDGLGTMFVTDGAGIYYYMGHNDTAEQLYCEKLDRARLQQLMNYGEILASDPVYAEAKAAPPGRQSSIFLHAGLAWDRAHAGKLPCLAVSKLWGYWRPFVNPATYGRATVAASLMALPVMILAALGLVWAWRRGERDLTVLVLLQLLAGTASAVIFSTEVRYRIQALDLFLVVYAASAVSEWLARRSET